MSGWLKSAGNDVLQSNGGVQCNAEFVGLQYVNLKRHAFYPGAYFGARVNAEFAIKPLLVHPRGGACNSEHFGNLRVRIAATDQARNLSFTWGKPRKKARNVH